jgi:hypothetical protein
MDGNDNIRRNTLEDGRVGELGMVKYTVWLDQPTNIIHAAVQNLGEAVRDKDGIFTVRLVDEENKPLSQKECGLAVSNKLGESYVYVSATPAGGLIKTGPIAASRCFQGIQIQYEAAFTDRPLTPSQLGSLFYSVPGRPAQSSESPSIEKQYTITKISQTDAVQELS